MHDWHNGFATEVAHNAPVTTHRDHFTLRQTALLFRLTDMLRSDTRAYSL